MRRVAVALVLAILCVPRPAHASFHLMKIVEVFGGTEAAPDAQYVVLQMYFIGQTFISGVPLVLYDAGGTAIPGGTFASSSNVSNGTNQATILIATSAAQTFFHVAADLTMAPVLPWGGGKACWTYPGTQPAIDCVAWGGYSGPAGIGPAAVGTPFNSPAGIPRGQAIHRSLGGDGVLQDADDTGDSAADFFAGPPTPRNNAGVLGGAPPSSCANGVLESLEGCDDGNTTNGDGCSSSCKPETAGTSAQALVVDPSPGSSSDGNGVLEPGETVAVRPTWKNLAASSRPLQGSSSSFTGPAGGDYQIPDGNARYGTLASGAMSDCQTGSGDCYQLFVGGAPRPVLHWDAAFAEALNNGDLKTWTIHVAESFGDVPKAYGFYRFVETLFHRGVTAGCTPGNYCPFDSVTRGQMAVFLLVSKEGAGYVPPACSTPVFADVPCSSPFARWVNELAARGVTGGCGGGNYCPGNPVTRAQMAVFLLVTREGSGYTPPACTTAPFADVPCSNSFSAWIQELVARGITAGCGGGNYCPGNPVTRGQMAVFLTTTFGLTL
ncbi:MAG TPA: S-layer homology domain-containing protein, partial [Candidatus Deferrimicrobium sp.]